MTGFKLPPWRFLGMPSACFLCPVLRWSDWCHTICLSKFVERISVKIAAHDSEDQASDLLLPACPWRRHTVVPLRDLLSDMKLSLPRSILQCHVQAEMPSTLASECDWRTYRFRCCLFFLPLLFSADLFDLVLVFFVKQCDPVEMEREKEFRKRNLSAAARSWEPQGMQEEMHFFARPSR